MRFSWGPRSSPRMPAPVFAAIAAGALVSARFLPVERLAPACPIRSSTGWPCLTCGSTRAFVRFVHGDLGGAFAMSPLGAALAITGALLVAYVLLRLTVLRRRPQLSFTARESRGIRWSIVCAVAVNWAYLVWVGR